MKNELRDIWKKLFPFDWKLGLFLILLICIPRFILVLKANSTGSYGAIGLIMSISALAPFIFLNKGGLKHIGITKSGSFKWLFIALIAGVAASLFLFVLGKVLYGNSYHNWYNYIGRSYQITEGISQKDKSILFAVTAITGMIFSPFGEEFFFRGIVHGAFAKSVGERKASFIDSGAFALTHISHFGLVFISGSWKFLFLPALIWVSAMFAVSLLFFHFKQKTKSIWGAVICHAGFNLGMIYSIFYLL